MATSARTENRSGPSSSPSLNSRGPYKIRRELFFKRHWPRSGRCRRRPDLSRKDRGVQRQRVAWSGAHRRLVAAVRNDAKGDFDLQRHGQTSHRASSEGVVAGRRKETNQMIRALFSAASGMNAQQTNVENIANNIANANTAGFKARRAQFQDLLYQNLIQPGAAATAEHRLPPVCNWAWVREPYPTRVIFTQGDFSETDNPLDLVIQGNGFFQVLQPSGKLAYTKAGTFHLNNTGQIVDPNGNLLDPPITDSAERPLAHHRQRRNGELHASRTGRGTASRPDSTRQLRQSFRLEQPRPKPFSADRRFRRTRDRAARRSGWTRHVDARLRGAIQRQHRSGIREPDRQPARV